MFLPWHGLHGLHGLHWTQYKFLLWILEIWESKFLRNSNWIPQISHLHPKLNGLNFVVKPHFVFNDSNAFFSEICDCNLSSQWQKSKLHKSHGTKLHQNFQNRLVSTISMWDTLYVKVVLQWRCVYSHDCSVRKFLKEFHNIRMSLELIFLAIRLLPSTVPRAIYIFFSFNTLFLIRLYPLGQNRKLFWCGCTLLVRIGIWIFGFAHQSFITEPVFFYFEYYIVYRDCFQILWLFSTKSLDKCP